MPSESAPLHSHSCRRYAEPLLDILIAGGQLAPGGKIESSVRAAVCVFTCEPMVESLKEHVQVREIFWLDLDFSDSAVLSINFSPITIALFTLGF